MGCVGTKGLLAVNRPENECKNASKTHLTRLMKKARRIKGKGGRMRRIQREYREKARKRYCMQREGGSKKN